MIPHIPLEMDFIIGWITHVEVTPSLLRIVFHFGPFPRSRRLVRGNWSYWTIINFVLETFIGFWHNILGAHLS
jgi:hypothetical protein